MRFAIVLAMVLAAGPALAADPAFTTDQRHAIVQIVRDALKNDPTILRDAVVALQADQQAKAAAEAKTMLVQKHQALVADAADPVAGNPAGDVTLVEFYDPRCPYCRRMLPAIAALLQKDRGVRLVYKDIPVLGPASVMESRAILAAQKQGAYGRMQDSLMNNPAQPNPAMIAETAHSLGLDPVRLAADMAGSAVAKHIDANMELARDLHVEGTPVFMVGETIIPGAVDEPALEAAIAHARNRG